MDPYLPGSWRIGFASSFGIFPHVTLYHSSRLNANGFYLSSLLTHLEETTSSSASHSSNEEHRQEGLTDLDR